MSVHIGSGYGSEFHLMRLMGRYRNEFNWCVSEAIGGNITMWLDFMKRDSGYDPSDPAKVKLPDAEWKGIDFLPQVEKRLLAKEWQKFWPQSGNLPNWDAVGRAQANNREFWVLVEAKAHLGEIKSDCGATSKDSISQINQAFQETQNGFGITGAQNWCESYYQAANRLAMLYFLNEICGIPTKMLCVYFCGDKNPHAQCPQNENDWKSAIAAQDKHLGLNKNIKEKIGWYSIFWNVA